MQYSLKWDAIDQFFPIRRFISECLRTGSLPLWCPYSNLGYPVHADPQSGSWYPIVWFFSLFSTYTIYTVSLEFILHIFLAGCGMFLLANSLKLSHGTSIFMAIAYMMSGIFVGNAQHTTWIISATWLPIILRSFLKLNFEPDLKHALLFALFFFMMMSGGYPAFVFVLVYILIVIFLVVQIPFLVNKNSKPVLKSLKFLVPAVIIALMLCAVSIVSIIEIIPYFSRGGGIPLNTAQFNPFSPKAAISLFTPFAIVKDSDFFDTDQSMANGYFGIIILIFFVLFVISKKKSKLEWLFFGIAVFCLLSAFGKYFFLRELLYKFLPLMGSFRFPSLFRIFFILFSILCAGFALQKFVNDPVKYRKKLLLSGSLITIFVAALFVFNINDFSLLKINVFDRTFYTEVYQNTTLNSRIAFQAFIQLLVLIIFVVFILKSTFRNEIFFPVLLIFVAAEMALAAQINIPVSVVNEHKPSSIHKYISGLPKGFVLPPNDKMKNFSDAGLINGPLWRNMNFFHKRPAWDGFNNFTLNNYQVFINSSLKDNTLENPFIFLSDKVENINESGKTSVPGKDPKTLFFYPDQYKFLKTLQLKNTEGDTVFITGFKANKITAQVESKNSQLLTLLQCYYQGWHVLIDDKESKMYSPDFAFISVEVPAGKHKVEFIYKLKPVIAAFYLTAISFILVISALVFLQFKQRKKLKSPA